MYVRERHGDGLAIEQFGTHAGLCLLHVEMFNDQLLARCRVLRVLPGYSKAALRSRGAIVSFERLMDAPVISGPYRWMAEVPCASSEWFGQQMLQAMSTPTHAIVTNNIVPNV